MVSRDGYENTHGYGYRPGRIDLINNYLDKPFIKVQSYILMDNVSWLKGLFMKWILVALDASKKCSIYKFILLKRMTIVFSIFIKRDLKLFRNLFGYFSIQTPISNGVRELLGTSGVTHLHNRRPRSIHQDFATMFNLPPVSLEIHLSLQGGSQAGRAEHL